MSMSPERVAFTGQLGTNNSLPGRIVLGAIGGSDQDAHGAHGTVTANLAVIAAVTARLSSTSRITIA